MLHHIGTVQIETPRLLLRPFIEADAPDMFANWAGDERVTRHLSWAAHRSVEQTRARILDWLPQYENPAVYHWALLPKESGRAAGSVSVQGLRERHLSCEIGYCLGTDFWNRGYMTEALRAVLDVLFARVGFHRVQAMHRAGNPASGRVMQKAGMVYEGTLRDFGLDQAGQWYSLCVYAALAPRDGDGE